MPTSPSGTTTQTYLLTGGGTIALQYLRFLIQSTPHQVWIIDRSESAVATLLSYQESLKEIDRERLHILWTDLCDQAALDPLANVAVDVVVHTAATKHFSLGRTYPGATYQSNMDSFMTVWNWARDSARSNPLKKFVFTSTDKVTGRSTNSMIRAKQDIEKVIRDTPSMPGVIVRFGNVLDSSDSLLPILRSCIRNGQTFHLRHPGMTRYLVTTAEATEVIHHAATVGTPQAVVSKLPIATRVTDIVSGISSLLGPINIHTEQNPKEENLHEALYTRDESTHTVVDANGFLEYHENFVGNLSAQETLAVTSSDNCLLSREQIQRILKGTW
jgi:UDP-N-acetylglucosamine 4,6-dehydratase